MDEQTNEAKSSGEPQMSREDVEAAERLTRDVQAFFRNVSEDSENFMTDEEIRSALDYDDYGPKYQGDMYDPETVLQNLSELSMGKDGAVYITTKRRCGKSSEAALLFCVNYRNVLK